MTWVRAWRLPSRRRPARRTHRKSRSPSTPPLEVPATGASCDGVSAIKARHSQRANLSMATLPDTGSTVRRRPLPGSRPTATPLRYTTAPEIAPAAATSAPPLALIVALTTHPPHPSSCIALALVLAAPPGRGWPARHSADRDHPDRPGNLRCDQGLFAVGPRQPALVCLPTSLPCPALPCRYEGLRVVGSA